MSGLVCSTIQTSATPHWTAWPMRRTWSPSKAPVTRQVGAEGEGGGRRLTLYTALHNTHDVGPAGGPMLCVTWRIGRGDRKATLERDVASHTSMIATSATIAMTS